MLRVMLQLVSVWCALSVFIPSAHAGSAAARDVLYFTHQGWIWSCDGDGGGRKRLVQGALPGTSPDGRRVAFFRPLERQSGGPGELSELWMLDVGSGASRRIASDVAALAPAVWSAAGDRLFVLIRGRDSRTRLVTMHSDGSGLRTLLTEGKDETAFLCSLSISGDGSLLVHDMVSLYWVDPDGNVAKRVPLEAVMGAEEHAVTSSDRVVVCPTDPTLMVFSRPCQGTERFEEIMHEPNTALFLHDHWLGSGKNIRITRKDITAFAPVWSVDGQRVYFTGYRDVQAGDADLFRIYRVGRFGEGLRELGFGECVSAGLRSAATQ